MHGRNFTLLHQGNHLPEGKEWETWSLSKGLLIHVLWRYIDGWKIHFGKMAYALVRAAWMVEFIWDLVLE